MESILHEYKLRLINLNQRNRALKLLRLSRQREMDLHNLAYIENESAEEILNKIIAGKPVSIINQLATRDESQQHIDRHFNGIYRSVKTIEEETGLYSFVLAYPFMQGKFLDGTIVRAPLVLFPLRLQRDFQQKPRWKIEPVPEENAFLNRSLFMAYERHQQHRFEPSFWEMELGTKPDIQEFLNALYKLFKPYGLNQYFDQELFQFKIKNFVNHPKEVTEKWPLGRLKIVPNAVLGVFPQSDSSLWYDYEKIEENPSEWNLDKYITYYDKKKSDPAGYQREKENFFVAKSDSSQEKVLHKAKKGNSLAVHGPPGTGKTQVILNLITDAIANGKKVLVCSQKRAALEVLHQRMKTKGLGNFAAQIHDFRLDRKKVFEQIRQQIQAIGQYKTERLDLSLTQWENQLRRNAAEIDHYQQEFDQLANALLTTSRFGISPHQLYLNTENTTSPFEFGETSLRFNYNSWLNLKEKITHICHYKEILHPNFSWYNRQSLHDWNREKHQKCETFLIQLPKQVSLLSVQQKELLELNPEIETQSQPLRDNQKFSQLAESFDSSNNQVAWENFAQDRYAFVKIGTALNEIREISSKLLKDPLLSKIPPQKRQQIINTLKIYQEKRQTFLPRLHKAYRKSAKVLKSILNKLNSQTIGQLNKSLKAWQHFSNQIKKLSWHFLAEFPLLNPQNWKEWLLEKENQLKLVTKLHQLSYWKALKPKLTQGKWDEKHWSKTNKFIQLHNQHLIQRKKFEIQAAQYLHPRQIESLLQEIKTGETLFTEKLHHQYTRHKQNLIIIDAQLNQLKPLEKELWQKVHTQMSNTIDSLPKTIQNTLFLDWIDALEQQFPILKTVSGSAIQSKIQAFSDKISQRRKAAAELVNLKQWDRIIDNIQYNRLKNPITYRELLHQVNKKKRIWPLRKLIQNFWDEGLTRLIPCWMASPEAASAIFPMQEELFDIIIFDEASQCYVERALPILLRGKQQIIAGDPKQLRPFNLYQIRNEVDESASFEEEMAVEVESVLDLAKNVFEEIHLNWHYRSKNEALINFSNHAFYENRLQMIPPAQIDEKYQPPIQFVRVKGKWQNRHNPIEAQATVDVLEELIFKQKEQSIGIITFNFFQQEAIKSLLEQRMRVLSPDKANTLRNLLFQETDQGVFVKNIENVQGDERDIILFSVGYGENEKGKLVTQFGLLSQEGGENRLNVAITRAKKQVYLLCSFEPAALNVEDSQHPGPRLFKAYLEYAKAVNTLDPKEIKRTLSNISPITEFHRMVKVPDNTEKTLADKIAYSLQKKGYLIQRNVGQTAYKIDIGIMNPEKSDEFLLGVECEGSYYFQEKGSKGREVYRPQMLREKGWKIHRVWARNFFLNPEAEIQKIIGQLPKP